MPKKSLTPAQDLGHRWYLAEWSTLAGKRQADAERELEWSRSTTSGLWNGTQRYTQERVDEAATWLKLEPYELLMPPEEAMALRRLRETAFAIAAEKGRPFRDQDPPAAKRATGRK